MLARNRSYFGAGGPGYYGVEVGNLSSDGGLLLLAQLDRRIGLTERAAGCIRDWRLPERVRHSLPELIRQRIYQIAAGYEDCNDADILRRDPALKLAVGRSPVSDPDLVLCQVASDNIEAGRLAATALAEVNPKAKVVILHHSINKACIDRVDGFKAGAAKHPEMTILDTQEGKGTTEGGRPVMRDLLGRPFPVSDGEVLPLL